jgi:hypothetical protein
MNNSLSKNRMLNHVSDTLSRDRYKAAEGRFTWRGDDVQAEEESKERI